MEKSNESRKEIEVEVKDDESINEAKSMIEESNQEIVEVPQEIVEELTTPKESSKSADILIGEARSMIEKSDNDTRSCMDILDEDVEKYEDAKSELINKSLNPSQLLLDQVGFDSSIEQELDEEGVHFDEIKTVEPIYVRELSSGKFGAFILAIMAGFAVIVAWIYVASNSLGMVIDISKIPTSEVQNKLLSWIGGGVTGGEGTPLMGIVILSVSAFIVIWIVFVIKVFLRESKNYQTAQKVKEEAEFYCTKKDECQKKMAKISEHLYKVVSAIETSKVYIDEQNATIRRIIHLEGQVEFDELHERSKEEIKNTNILVNGIKQLISTPMASEYGALLEDAEVILMKTQKRQEAYREKLYK